MRYGVKVLPCVANTSSRGKGDMLYLCPMGMTHEITLELITTLVIYLISLILDFFVLPGLISNFYRNCLF